MKDHAAIRLGAGIAAGPAVAFRRRRPVSASSVAGRSATLRRSAAVMLTRAPPVLAHARTSLPPGYCRIVMLVASSPLTRDRLQAERVPHDRYACRSVGLSAPFGVPDRQGSGRQRWPAMTPTRGSRQADAPVPRRTLASRLAVQPIARVSSVRPRSRDRSRDDVSLSCRSKPWFRPVATGPRDCSARAAAVGLRLRSPRGVCGSSSDPRIERRCFPTLSRASLPCLGFGECRALSGAYSIKS